MTRARRHVAALGAGLLLLATACTGGSGDGDGDRAGEGPGVAEAGRDAGLSCAARNAVPLARKLSSGASWAVCLHVDPKLGMVLGDLTLTPPEGEPLRIARQVSLSQLEVPYDTGARTTTDITSAGFGGLKMADLTEAECPGELVELPVPDIGDGSQFGETRDRPVLCSEVRDAGPAYRSEENGELLAARHDAWTLSTVSKVGWYEYVSTYTLGSDGSITPELGATGDLSPVDWTSDPAQGSAVANGQDAAHAASHAHNAVWRIHWALAAGDEAGPLAVEQYDATPTGRTGPKSPVLKGGLTPIPHPTTARRADRRWWRVLAPGTRNADGHPVSYEISLGATDSFAFTRDQREHGAGAGFDVAFTNADECHVFASENGRGCGDGVVDFVADTRAERLTDVVSWVAVGFHHVPRDEDQSPMQVHWQGFALVPRDLTAQRLDVPSERETLNGQPGEWNGERVEDLVSPTP